MKQSPKVCHITSVHKRYDRRIFERECVSLARIGYRVSLLVNDGHPTELKNGVLIKSVQNRLFKSRLLRMVFSSRLFYAEALKTHAEIYHLHDPELLPLARKLHRNDKKVIFDNHEDVPKQILDKSYIPIKLRPFISHVYRRYEEKTLSMLNGVIIVTPSQRDRIEKVQKNVVMVTNYPSIIGLQSENKADCNRERQICFAGGIEAQWCHEKILSAIVDIDNLHYCLAGDNSQDPQYWKWLIAHNEWKKNLEYLGILDNKGITRLYERSLCGMALLSFDSPCGREGTLGNTKLFEYMKYGLPVICSDMKLWRPIIEKYRCGICVDPNNKNDIREAILYLLNNPLLAQEMGKNGIEAVYREFNWESQIDNLRKIYGCIIDAQGLLRRS